LPGGSGKLLMSGSLHGACAFAVFVKKTNIKQRKLKNKNFFIK